MSASSAAAPPPLEPGVYEHYKGNRYEVLMVAQHSETEEEFVVYRQSYGDGGAWVRPLAMFLETVDVNGERMPRFRRVRSVESPGAEPRLD